MVNNRFFFRHHICNPQSEHFTSLSKQNLVKRRNNNIFFISHESIYPGPIARALCETSELGMTLDNLCDKLSNVLMWMQLSQLYPEMA